jgi:hypothetical protein
MQGARLGLAMAAVAALGSGCGVQAREARAVQPNPLDLTHSADQLPVSQRLFIYQRDYNLPRDYQLRNWAEFAVVSRDRLRFHVGVVRYEESDADARSWKVWLEDETGQKLEPEGLESPHINRVAVNWRLYPYTPGDPWCKKPPCLSVQQPGYTVFEGRADFTFHEANLARRSKSFSLNMERDGVRYRYTWRFGDAVVLEHYGRSRVDDELGIIAVPGPYTQVAGTVYEDGR